MTAVAVAAPPGNSVIGFGEKFKDTPEGPLAVSSTAEENPPKELTVTVAVVDVPGRMLRLEGATAIVKSIGKTTCKVNWVE
jgi:hypothetical protein